MENRSIFVVTPYSPSINKNWLEDCVASVENQNYLVNHILIEDTEKLGACYHHFNALKRIEMSDDVQPNDIVIHLDGDDCFISNFAIETIVKEYDRNPKLAATYGNYVSIHGSICEETYISPRERILKNGWCFSHPRTFKVELIKNLREEDMKDSKGNWFSSAADVAIFCPILEMATPSRIKFIKEPLVYYRVHSNNDHANQAKLQDQVRCAVELFQKPNYKPYYA